MWCGLWGDLVEDLAHFGGLVFAPFADGGAAADGCVLLLDLGGAAGGDYGADVVLEAAEGDEVAVCLCSYIVSTDALRMWCEDGRRTNSLDRKS